MEKHWAKLQEVKKSHKKEFAGIHNNIKGLETKLEDIQAYLRDNPLHTKLHTQEKYIICMMRFLRGIESSALPQKS